MGRVVFCGPSTLPPGGWTFTLVTVAQIALEAPSPPLVNYEFLEGTYAVISFYQSTPEQNTCHIFKI